MAEPTLVDYQQSTWTDDTSASEATPAITWQTGDRILVVGATEDSAVTLNTPTATGLTFSLLTSVGGAANTQAYMWSALAAGNGSSAVTATHNGGASYAKGISAFVYRGSDGFGTPATITGSAAKVISLTRVQANSHVAIVLADWNAVGDATIDPTPSLNAVERVEALVAARADFIVYSWGDQGATGTTSYGVTNHTGTVDMTGIVVEVKGTAAGGAITGTIALTVTPAGALTGSGALAGSVALSLAPTGALTGDGALVGNVLLAVDATGALAGVGALDGSVVMALAPTGTLSGAGALAANVPLAFDLTGTLANADAGAIAGSVLLTVNVTGAMTGAGALAGSVSLVCGVSGALTGEVADDDGFADAWARARKKRQERVPKHEREPEPRFEDEEALLILMMLVA